MYPFVGVINVVEVYHDVSTNLATAAQADVKERRVVFASPTLTGDF